MTNLLDTLKQHGEPILERSEEKRTIRKAQSGHQSAKDLLVSTMYWSVIDFASKLAGPSTPEPMFEDMLMAGVEAVCAAVPEYELDSKASFRTFCSWRVRGAMMREMSKHFSHLSVPHNAVGDARNLQAGSTAKDLGITEAKAYSLLHCTDPIYLDEDGSADPIDGEDAIDDEAWMIVLNDALYRINPDAYFVTCFSYGILGFAKLSRAEIQSQLGFTGPQVVALLEEGVEALRVELNDIGDF